VEIKLEEIDMTGHRNDRRARRGFTLMEVLLVLAILVILGSLAVGVFSGVQKRANKNAAKSQIGLIDSQLRQYNFDTGQYPADLSALRYAPTYLADTDKWNGPYLDRDVPPDPWGREYQYNIAGGRNNDKPDVWSLGEDGLEGTDDDVGNWQ
jgi:general secretion pathway protein G